MEGLTPRGATVLQTVLGWWLVLTLVLITVVDVLAIVNASQNETVSYWLYKMGQRHPAIYLMVGVALGHLIFPLIVRNGGN